MSFRKSFLIGFLILSSLAWIGPAPTFASELPPTVYQQIQEQGLSTGTGLQPAVMLGQTNARTTASRIISVLLGLLGVICVIGIVFGIPFGIILLVKKKLDPSLPYDERSGKGPSSVIPSEIQGWNWGAAGLPKIWGIYHNVWICLLDLVPFVSLVWWIVMGVKGNEWAWKKNRWVSVEHFRYVQRKWEPWGIAFFVLNILGTFFWLLAQFSRLAH